MLITITNHDAQGKNCRTHKEQLAEQKAKEKQKKISGNTNSSMAPSVSTSNASTSFFVMNKTIQPTIKELLIPSNATQKKKERALAEIHMELFRCFSDNNISPNVLRNESFPRLIRTIISNSIPLQNSAEKDLVLGRRRYFTLQAESLAEMVYFVQGAVERVRNFHMMKSGTQDRNAYPSFIYVAHDIWDGKRKCVLGLTIFFSDPQNARNIMLPLGFVTSKGKSAKVICDQSLDILSRYGILTTDLLSPINDTTNSALAAGRLIVGGGVDGTVESGTCYMHRGALAINHASGFLQRSVNRKVTDSFPQSANFKKKVKEMVSYIMDKKSKEKNKRYASFVRKHFKTEPIVLPVPNQTRVTGTSMMYEAALRSCHALRCFATASARSDPGFVNLCLEEDEWAQLAEYYAVFRIFSQFLLQIQTDDYGVISLTRLHLGYMMISLFKPDYKKRESIYKPKFERMKLDVADVRKGEWSPSTPYNKIPKVSTDFVMAILH